MASFLVSTSHVLEEANKMVVIRRVQFLRLRVALKWPRVTVARSLVCGEANSHYNVNFFSSCKLHQSDRDCSHIIAWCNHDFSHKKKELAFLQVLTLFFSILKRFNILLWLLFLCSASFLDISCCSCCIDRFYCYTVPSMEFVMEVSFLNAFSFHCHQWV